MNDPKMHSKGAVTLLEGCSMNSAPSRALGSGLGAPIGGVGAEFDMDTGLMRDANKLYGISPSDIDKYSRIVFPVCFVCFNLMYWIIYLHISDVLAEDIVPLKPE